MEGSPRNSFSPITVPVINDLLVEATETVVVTLGTGKSRLKLPRNKLLNCEFPNVDGKPIDRVVGSNDAAENTVAGDFAAA